MSATTVPLQPVNKSGLWAIWLGALVLVAAAVYLAVSQTPRIGFTVVHEGTGASPTQSDVVLIKYEGKLDDGTVFDSNEQAPMAVSQVVPGFSKALVRMKKGGTYNITIPPRLGYGDKASGPIPANSTLHFSVTLIDFRSEAEVRAMQQMMQQQQMQQPGAMPAQ